MLDPFWVAGGRPIAPPSAWQGNHWHVLRNEEGRTRPASAFAQSPNRFEPWIRPSTAKSASSQGGALATAQSVENTSEYQTEDMIMEYCHEI